MFIISIFWPGMVLNQGQLSTIVSDWESYLGSVFSLCYLWEVIFVSGTIALLNFTVVSSVLVLLVTFISIKTKCTLTTLHLGLLPTTAMTGPEWKGDFWKYIQLKNCMGSLMSIL